MNDRIGRGLDWARVPTDEQARMEAKATKAKIRVEWTNDDSGRVLAEFDGLDFRQIGELVWDWQHGWFFFKYEPATEVVQRNDVDNQGRIIGRVDVKVPIPGESSQVPDGGDLIDVDPDSRLKFNNELVEAGRVEGSLRDVRMAELRGRLNMHRDETRGLAVLGARVMAKRWLPTYLSLV